MSEIVLTFEWDGETVHKETSGYTGNACVQKTAWVENSLGKGGKHKMKAEGFGDKNIKQSERYSN